MSRWGSLGKDPPAKIFSNNTHGSEDEPDNEGEQRQRRIHDSRVRRENRERKTLIFSSSITRSLNKHGVSQECKGKVFFHEFKGKKASDIVRYIDPHLMDNQPHNVMFIAGGNDLPFQVISNEKIKKVAKCLIDGGLRCKNEFGVTNVFISGVLPRDNNDFETNRHRLNNMLRDMCVSNDFKFIENSGIISKSHLLNDGIHLNKRGSGILHANIVDNINS